MIPEKPKNKRGKRRWNLWMNNNRCFYCNKKLKWEESTLEHLNSKVLRNPRPQIHGITTTLSCSSCNQDRARVEMISMPRSYWWKRSRQFPRWNRKDLTWRERIFIIWYGKILRMGIDRRK